MTVELMELVLFAHYSDFIKVTGKCVYINSTAVSTAK